MKKAATVTWYIINTIVQQYNNVKTFYFIIITHINKTTTIKYFILTKIQSLI